MSDQRAGAELVVAFDDADIIVESVDVQDRRPPVRIDDEAAATADGNRHIVRSRKIGLDSEMPDTAVALAEIRSSLAAREAVVRYAGSIDDIGSEQVRASQCK